MSNKHEDITAVGVENIQSTLDKLNAFFLHHKKLITYVAVGVLVIAGGFFGYKYLYAMPRANQAAEEIFYAQQYFAMDSIQQALKGDGQHAGFLDIIDNYGGTPSANLSYYYAGVCYLNMGEFQNAIDFLKKFHSKDLLLAPMAEAVLGDAYLELKDLDAALSCYQRASKKQISDFVTPGIMMKEAFVYEQKGNLDKALKIYEQIQKDHPKSLEAREIDKYIAKTKAALNQ